jgi:hypothetical protein
MSRTIVIRLGILVAIVGWPSFFAWLADADARRSAIWGTLQQVYYLPFSWVGPPLFQLDSEGGLAVQPTGRAFAVFFYVLIFYVVVRIVDRHKLASAYAKRKSDVVRD